MYRWTRRASSADAEGDRAWRAGGVTGTVLCMVAQGRYRHPLGVHDRDWPSWTVIPPCVLAGLLAPIGLLLGLAGEAFRSVYSEGVLGYVPPSGGWVAAGIAGGFIAMVAALVAAKSIRPRRIAALTAWGIVLLQVGWFVLADRMAFFHGI